MKNKDLIIHGRVILDEDDLRELIDERIYQDKYGELLNHFFNEVEKISNKFPIKKRDIEDDDNPYWIERLDLISKIEEEILKMTKFQIITYQE